MPPWSRVVSSSLGSTGSSVLSFAKKVALLLVSCGVALLGAEVVLRLVGYSYSPMKIEVEGGKLDWRYHHSFQDHHFVWDPLLLWRPRAGHSVFNRQGFRGRELEAAKPPGQVRIFALGDSNTLGWDGADGAHWPGDLEAVLRERTGRDVVVLNAGAWGYSSYQGRARMVEVLAWEPDIILVCFGANDAHQVWVTDAEYAAVADRFRPSLFRTRLGQLGVEVRDQLVLGSADSNESRRLVFRVDLDAYRDNLRTIVRESREHGVEPVLLTRPYIGSTSNPLWWKHYGPQYRLATLDLAEEEDVLAVDVYQQFHRRRRLFADESHFTAEGHRRSAELLADDLLMLLP